MTMLDIHREALLGEQPLYHEFLSRYAGGTKCVYGFVEGKDDPCFYTGAIQGVLGEGWTLDLWLVGNRDKVVKLYNSIDWTRFPRTRVLFFIDRDLSIFLHESLPSAENVYITDKYSIENAIVSRSTCDRLLSEVCNLNSVPMSDKDNILTLFEEQLKLFQEEMTPLMAHIICWRRSGQRPNLDNIKMKHLFAIKAGKVTGNSHPRGLSNPEEYIHKQCKIKPAACPDIVNVEKEFRQAKGPQKFIRGKYELWFMIEFALSVCKEIRSFTASVPSPPKMNVSLSMSNAVVLIGPRALIPKSLTQFLQNTCLKYAHNWET